MSGSMETNLLNSGNNNRMTYKELELKRWTKFRENCNVRVKNSCKVIIISCKEDDIGMNGCPLWYAIKNRHLAKNINC